MVGLSVMLASATALMATSGILLTRMLFRPLSAFAVPVLRYRFTGPPLPGSPFNRFRVSGLTLAKHFDFLRRRQCRIVTLSEAIANVKNSEFLESRPVVLCFDGGYETLHRIVKPRLEENGFTKANVFLATDAIGADNRYEIEGAGRPEVMLSEAQIRELSDLGWEIGSLGQNGLNLSALSAAQLLEHLKNSRKKLEAIISKPVRLLAYPVDVDISAQQLLIEQAGYDYACWISLDGLLEKNFDRFRVPRYPLNRNSQLIEMALVVAQRMI